MTRKSVKEAMLVFLALAGTAAAQQAGEVKSSIVYLAGTTVYLNSGGLARVTVGDSAAVYRANEKVGSLVVIATADSSSAARISYQSEPFIVGDTVTIYITTLNPTSTAKSLNLSAGSTLSRITTPVSPHAAGADLVSGRVALQYNLVAAEDASLNLSQPAALLQLNVANLLGAGMRLTVYGVSFLNGNGAYALYGNRAGLQNDIYQISLTGEVPGAGLGYGFGRLTSPYVSGLGTFDGGEIHYRIGDFTVGAVGGGAPLVPASTLGYSGTKTAAFVNYATGTDFLHRYDGTLAYALRTVDRMLDRNYLYLQNSLSLGPQMYFYESSEIDLSRLSNGTRRPGFNFSNTFFSMNYFPARWLFANIGYDAYRNVYLFQTMKSLPDSLFDNNILQDFRGSVTAYLPGAVALSANGSYGISKSYARSQHTLGASVRGSDLLGLGVGGSIRYTNMFGVYSNANDVRLELDDTFFDALDVTLSYDSYDIAVSILQQTYTTQTISGYLNYVFWRKWYSSLGVDDVIDPSMNSLRIFTEIGFRF